MHFRYTAGIYFTIFFCAIQFSLVELHPHPGQDKLFPGKNKYSNPEPKWPIDVNSTAATYTATSPLIFIGVIGEAVKLVNDGESVEAIVIEKPTLTRVTEGPFGKDVYIIHKLEYLWTNNAEEFAATTLDGKDGAPLEVVVYFFNIKYGTFENSKNHKNGMAVFSFRVAVGGLENLRFIPFEPKLRGISKPGETESNLGQAFAWFDNYLLNTEYFFYPGSYTDSENKTYYCTTNVIFPKASSISYFQFKRTFLQLKDKDGKQLTNTRQQHSYNGPLQYSDGVVQFLVPIGSRLVDLPL